MRYRLLAPVAVAGAIALGAWLPTVASAGAATPSLSPLSADQLVAKAQAARVAGFSGTVRWTAALGLPSLSTLTSGVGGQGAGHAFDPTSLLSGSHDISVWDAGPARQRLALPGSLSEVDVIHNGGDLYYFDSATQTVTHYTGIRAGSGRQAPGDATGTPLTPDQAAQRLLSGLTPSTGVSVVTPVYVAGQAAYQLVLTPKAPQSTVGSVDIAIDAANGMPLRVQVVPRGSRTPALSLGFTGISFAVPSAGNFAAPHGSSTVTVPIRHAFDAGGDGAAPGVRFRHGHLHGSGPATDIAPAAAPATAQAMPAQSLGGVQPSTPLTPPSTPLTPPPTPPARPVPGLAASATPPVIAASGPVTATLVPVTAPAERSTTIGSDWATIAVFHGATPRLLGELTKVGTPVAGSFGTARLVTSALLDALVLPDGKVLVGFVTPAALEAAASSVS